MNKVLIKILQGIVVTRTVYGLIIGHTSRIHIQPALGLGPSVLTTCAH